MNSIIDEPALDSLFRSARTHVKWRQGEISAEQIRAMYEVFKFGPTSVNCNPARFIWLTTPSAKARLLPHLSGSNRTKVESAAATVIVAYDLNFANQLERLFPHVQGVKAWFPTARMREETAFRNSTLQAAYLLIAARALGWDAGPMSGFDNASVDTEFFPDAEIRSNLIIAVGQGDADALYPRLPRFEFAEVNTIL